MRDVNENMDGYVITKFQIQHQHFFCFIVWHLHIGEVYTVDAYKSFWNTGLNFIGDSYIYIINGETTYGLRFFHPIQNVFMRSYSYY